MTKEEQIEKIARAIFDEVGSQNGHNNYLVWKEFYKRMAIAALSCMPDFFKEGRRIGFDDAIRTANFSHESDMSEAVELLKEVCDSDMAQREEDEDNESPLLEAIRQFLEKHGGK